MADYLVTCVTKPDRNSPHEHITHIGGDRGTITRDQAIQFIDSGQHRFYAQDPSNGKTAWVGVVRVPGKHAYLRTHADGDWSDNLLAQNEWSLVR